MVSIANWFRLGFMTLHTGLFFAAFIQGMVQINPLIIFIMGLISGILLVLYLPVAAFLTLRRKWTWWDRGYLEVPYIAVQAIIWFLLAVFGALSEHSWICTGDPPAGARNFHFDNAEYAGPKYCKAVTIFQGLAWGNFGVAFIWLVYTLVAIKASRNNEGRPMGTSMGLIMEGDHAHPLPGKGKEVLEREPSPTV